MEKMPFDITDLVPKETTFALMAFPERQFTLCKWSLRVRAWASKKYGSEKLKEIFSKQQIDEIAVIAFFMLADDDKEFFINLAKEKKIDNVFDCFLDSISSVKDQVGVVTALLGAVGIGEPEMDQITAALKEHKKAEGESADPNAESPSEKTGAKSLTP